MLKNGSLLMMTNVFVALTDKKSKKSLDDDDEEEDDVSTGKKGEYERTTDIRCFLCVRGKDGT